VHRPRCSGDGSAACTLLRPLFTYVYRPCTSSGRFFNDHRAGVWIIVNFINFSSPPVCVHLLRTICLSRINFRTKRTLSRARTHARVHRKRIGVHYVMLLVLVQCNWGATRSHVSNCTTSENGHHVVAVRSCKYAESNALRSGHDTVRTVRWYARCVTNRFSVFRIAASRVLKISTRHGFITESTSVHRSGPDVWSEKIKEHFKIGLIIYFIRWDGHSAVTRSTTYLKVKPCLNYR
jgi:hypothetical protein